MSDLQINVPGWFMVIAVLALLWNGIGVMAYLDEVSRTPEALTAMTEAQRNLFATRPAWATAGFAFAVFGGLLGCILLLLRRQLATVFFAISLLGLIVQNYHSFFVARVHQFLPASAIILDGAIFLIAILLLWLSRSSTDNGWLG